MNVKHNTWVEINREALKKNMHLFRTLSEQKQKIMAVVKANAYGHGAVVFSKLAVECGADWLGVYSLDEAIELREGGVEAPIFILGFVMPENMQIVSENGFSVGIVSLEQLNETLKVLNGKKLNVHLKLDTGLRRLGFFPEEIPQVEEILAANSNINLEGLYTHFADIEDTTTHEFAKYQRELFEKMCAPFKRFSPLRHCACSAASLLFPSTYFEMLRTGISMYGMWPSRETFITSLMTDQKDLFLFPVLSWKSRIAQIKKVVPGDTVGYGRTHRITREGLIAVIPVGYSDGYDRSFSNNSYVLIRGEEAPVVGRICMNMFMADVSHINGVKMCDEVVMIGRQGDREISADTLADFAGTINYEITTRINPMLPRIIV